MVNKASATNRNNIIIHNVVNAETKKRTRKHRRVSSANKDLPDVQPLIPTQQLAPQVFPQQMQLAPQQSGPDPDLVQAVRDSVSSQAAMLNEFQDQRQREQDMFSIS